MRLMSFIRHSYINGISGSYTGTASQGFAGFNKANETDSSRESYAMYTDVIHHFSDNLSLEGALRYEHYSDFGKTTNYKLAAGYKIAPKILLRSSVSTGFRAPSLAQINYSQTSSFVDKTTGKLSTQGTFKIGHEVSQALGAQELKPEESQHFTLGSVYQITKEMALSLDYFYTFVDNRIMLSDELKGTTQGQQAFLASHGVSSVRFLTNAVNTRTQGVDLKFNYKYLFANHSKLDLGFWYSFNHNKITEYNNTIISPENSFEQIDRTENGQPKTTARILSQYEIDKFNITVNLNHFGHYKQVIKNQSYKFKSRWTTDLDINYKVNEKLNIAIGGHNIFDIYPNKWDGLSGNIIGYNAIIPYSTYSPFGYSGAYYYLRASLGF